MNESKCEKLRSHLRDLAKNRIFKSVKIGDTEFTIRSLTMKEQSENDALLFGQNGQISHNKTNRMKCDLLCRCVVDPDSKEPLFKCSEWREWEEVPSPIVEKLIGVINSLHDTPGV